MKESVPGTDEHSLTHPTRPSGLAGVKQAIKEHIPGTDAHRHRTQDIGENAKELVPGKNHFPLSKYTILSCSLPFYFALEQRGCLPACRSNVIGVVCLIILLLSAGTHENQKATESTGEQVKRHIPGTKEHHTANEGLGEKVTGLLCLIAICLPI